MSKRPIWRPLAAALGGAATAYVLTRQAKRYIRNHRAAERHARDSYVAAYPVRRSRARVAGCDTHIYQAGLSKSSNPPILLLHGGVVEAASWLDTMAALAVSRHVIAPDLPAHGDSGYLAPGRLMDWLETFVETCLPGRFDLMGHSMGGGLALRYAADHGRSRLRRLVLCAPVSTGQLFPRIWPEPWNTGLLGIFPLHHALIEKVWGDPSAITPTQRWQFSLMFRSFFLSRRWWWYLSGGARWLFDLPPQALAPIAAPALFVWGDQDRIVPFCGARTLRCVQAVPHARLHILPGLGHLPQVEDPQAFNPVVQEFLR